MGATTSIHPNSTITGPALPEPVEVHAVTPMGKSARIMRVGRRTGAPYNTILTAEQLAAIEVLTNRVPFDGDARRFRLGIEAHRLGLAHEYGPFFALSIARVDPLPHQLEAAYEYFLKLPRIRFLLADDPGPGKTVMASLLIKELNARGLAQRILIVAPAHLTFQWQRGTRGQVPREVRDHPRRHAPGQLRPEPVAGTRPGRNERVAGGDPRGRPRKPAAIPLGPRDFGRGPQDERPLRGLLDLRLPARQIAL